MYQRIMNKLDAEIVEDALKIDMVSGTVIERIKDLVLILDGEYGSHRSSSDMGGYILLFTEMQSYEKFHARIIEFYHLDKDLYEYSEMIGSAEDGTVQWWEELYLLSSDDALVLIYPKDSDGC